eukprot:CAMPEP_0205828938 /NCGR_PEP_ID=MMETSP0206-20130828/36537_1 /ASSEMBLY_ACC=CAM_ASM_000279 /TAXON_ID=36767 /ORGANISM="Euplotes focardii, Strain TN1" /LENGTH=237 /DNA_ID=CAMNT_0053131203 /DNA_START=2 /DNA_END=712 /DNA_ORIENTATION=+
MTRGARSFRPVAQALRHRGARPLALGVGLAGVSGLAYQQPAFAVPIPKRQPGIVLGDRNAPVTLEFYMDFQCPFSNRAWPKILKLRDELPRDVCIVIIPCVIPAHRQSWHLLLAANAVAEGDPGTFIQFAEVLFDQQKEFLNASQCKKTEEDLKERLAELGSKFLLHKRDDFVSKSHILERMAAPRSSTLSKRSTRLAAKRGVWSTPTFFLNGSEVTNLGSSSSTQDWVIKIKALLK